MKRGQQQHISVRRVRTSLRPTRLALLIADDASWAASCRRCVEWLSEIWGGEYSLILPISSAETLAPQFWFLLEKFDPDYLFAPHGMPALALDAQIRQRLNPFHLQRSILQLPPHPQAGPAAFSPLSVVLPNALEHLPYIVPDLGALPTDLGLAVASNTGLATNDLLERLTLAGAIPMNAATKGPDFLSMSAPADLLSMMFIGDAPQWRHQQTSNLQSNLSLYTPFGQGKTGLGRYFPVAGSSDDAVLIIGDECQDFCLYFCLSRLRADAYWLPVRLLADNLAPPDAEYRALLYDRLRDVALQQRRIRLASMSLGGTSIDQAVSAFNRAIAGQTTTVVDDPTQLLPYLVKCYETDAYGLVKLEQFLDGLSMSIVDTPKPKRFAAVPLQGHNWVVEVSIEQYQLPRRAALAKIALGPANYTTSSVRISTEGIAYMGLSPFKFLPAGIDANLFRPRVRLLTDSEVFSTLYRAAGFEPKPSDKGNYHREVVRIFDGLEGAAKFFGSQVGSGLLSQYLLKEPSASGQGVLLNNDRRYLDFAAIAAASHCYGAETVALIDDLIALGVLSRGLVLKCGRCSYSAWYHVADVTQEFVCARCRQTQQYKHEHWRDPNEPSWYYDLNEVVYQFYSHNGLVPMLSLLALSKRGKESLLYIPETRLDGGAIGSGKEIDFTVSIDGDLCLGEATVSSALGQTATEETKRLADLRKLCEAMGANAVVLSTLSGAWSEQTTARAGSEFASSRVQVIFLTKADLPNFQEWERVT